MKEQEWKRWLARRAEGVLNKVGVDEDDVILDFGCGSGNYTLPASRLAHSGKVWALDSNARRLEEVLERSEEEGRDNIEVIASENLDTGLETSCVDKVLLFDVIHAVEARERLLREICRVLKPEGRVAVYPMHVGNCEVEALMRRFGFCLVSEYYDGHILKFARAGDEK